MTWPSSSSPYVKIITNPTDAEMSRMTDIFVEAFKNDPLGLIMLGNDYSLAPVHIHANLCAALIGGAIHVVATGPELDDMCGVAIWYPPGKSLFASPAEKAAWAKFITSVPEPLRVWWTDCFGPKMDGLCRDNLGEGFADDAWYLHILAVAPKHQKKGYGRVLLDYANKLATETDSPLVVATAAELNIKIYTRLGYGVAGRTEINSEYGNENVWLMVKLY